MHSYANPQHEQRLKALVEEMAVLRQQGREILLVSSGAVALGMKQLGLAERKLVAVQPCQHLRRREAALAQAKRIPPSSSGVVRMRLPVSE